MEHRNSKALQKEDIIMMNNMNRVQHIEKLHLRQARYELMNSINELYGGDSDMLMENDYAPGLPAGYDYNGDVVAIDNDTFAVLMGKGGVVVALTESVDVAYEFVTLGLGEAVILKDTEEKTACDIQMELINLMEELYDNTCYTM